MRTLTKSLVAALILVLLTSFDHVLLSSRLYLDTPRLHLVHQGEHLSGLAEAYYGHPAYWRILALINRAPNADVLLPGEILLLPSQAAMAELAAAQTLTRVNEIVNNQMVLAELELQGDWPPPAELPLSRLNFVEAPAPLLLPPDADGEAIPITRSMEQVERELQQWQAERTSRSWRWPLAAVAAGLVLIAAAALLLRRTSQDATFPIAENERDEQSAEFDQPEVEIIALPLATGADHESGYAPVDVYLADDWQHRKREKSRWQLASDDIFRPARRRHRRDQRHQFVS